MLKSILTRAARSDRARRLVECSRPTRRVVDRFVPGETVEAALAAVGDLRASGRMVSLDVLGEDVVDRAGADQTREAYLALLAALADGGWGDSVEVSLKLSALGQALRTDSEAIALENARRICAAASAIGTTVTLDMEDHTTVDSTLAIGEELRVDHPLTGVVLQSNLRRTEADIAALSGDPVRVRLVKGAYREPESVAFQSKDEVDAAYLRGIGALMRSRCYPMVATHDVSMVRAAVEIAGAAGRKADDWELQMLFGIGDERQRGLHAAGHRVRVYVPFGTDWYAYFMRRLAERPANVAFFLRALARA